MGHHHKQYDHDQWWPSSYKSYSLFKYSSVPTSIWITLMFVISLYLWPKHRQRTQRSTVIRRLISITVSAAVSVLIVYFYSRYHSNKSWLDLLLSFRLRKLKIKDVLWPLIITATIFLGPIVDDFIGSRWTFESWRRRPDFLTLAKNLFLAPLIEEIVFRCINCTLLSNQLSFGASVVISGLLFGLAHMHPQIMQHVFMDMERELLLHSIMAFLYTSAFGMYVAAIFMRTQSLWPPTLVHIFCNFMGLPSGDIWRTRRSSMLTTSGLVGGLLLYTQFIMGADGG